MKTMKTKLLLSSIFSLFAIITLGVQIQCTGSTTLKATKDGIGVLAFGSQASELPAAVNGMYDRIDSEYDDFEGTTIYRLYLGDDLKYVLMTSGEITNIEVHDPNVDFGGFRVGDPISKIMELNPKQELKNSGLEMTINGCYIGFMGALNESGMAKYNRAYANLESVTLDISDFQESATLGFVIINKDSF